MKDLTKKQKKVFWLIALVVGIAWLTASLPDYIEGRKATARDKAEMQAKIEVKGESPEGRMMNTSFDLCSVGETWVIHDRNIVLRRDHDKDANIVGTVQSGTIVRVVNTYGSWKLCETSSDMLGWIDNRTVKTARRQ